MNAKEFYWLLADTHIQRQTRPKLGSGGNVSDDRKDFGKRFLKPFRDPGPERNPGLEIFS